MVFATVPDEHETNYVSPVSTSFRPDIRSLASSALLSNQSLVAEGWVSHVQGSNLPPNDSVSNLTSAKARTHSGL
jgi:hypothetical protein